MKKVFLVAALAVFGMSKSDAQVKFGVKAGPQITNLIGDDVSDDKEAKVGVNVGGYANIRFSEQLAFQPELLFSLQGNKQTEKEEALGTTTTWESKNNLSYINVPLMLKWYAYEGLNFEFGPQVGFNVGAKNETTMKISNNNGTITTESDGDIKNIETVDFGLNIGAGYELPMGLNFGLRYTHGLTNIVKDFDAKNSVIALGVGYTF